MNIILVFAVLIPTQFQLHGQGTYDLKTEWLNKASQMIPVDYNGDGIDEFWQINYREDNTSVSLKKSPFEILSQTLVNKDYHFLSVGSFDKDQKPQVVYSLTERDTAYLVFSDSNRLKIASGKSKRPPKGWDGGINDLTMLDVNGDGRRDIIASIYSGSDLQPRGIYAIDPHTKKELWHYFTGPVINRIITTDVNGDGYDEIVCGSISYSNGSETNGTDDNHSYIFVLNRNGKLLWKEEIGAYFSVTICAVLKGKESEAKELVVAEMGYSGEQKENDQLFILDGKTGKKKRMCYASHRIRGMCLGDLDGAGEEEIVVGNTDGKIQVFDRNLKEKSHYKYPNGGVCVEAISKFNNASNSDVVFVTADGWVGVLDNKLQELAGVKVDDIYDLGQTAIAVVWPVRQEGGTKLLVKVQSPDLFKLLALEKIIDEKPPQIVISEPSKATEVNDDKIEIRGRITDNVSVDKILINGKQIAGVNKDTIFSLEDTVELSIGANPIVVAAYDLSGNCSACSLNVFRKSPFPKVWAVVIGISKYRDQKLSLQFADRDAQSFIDFLQNQKDNRVFTDLEIKKMFNDKASLVEIKTALGGDFLPSAKPNDLVFIFFAGHGSRDSKTGIPYLLAYDSNQDNLYATALPMSEITNLLNEKNEQLQSKKVIAFVDACHSGAIGSGIRGEFDLYDEFQKQLRNCEGRVVITSSRGNELAKEDDGLQHGVFTYYLVQGLKGAADSDKNGIVTEAELCEYLDAKVPAATKNNQHPTPYGMAPNAMPLSLVK